MMTHPYFAGSTRLAAVLITAILVVSPVLAAEGGDAAWKPMNDFGDQIGFIDAVRSDGEKLYLGGTFSTVNGQPFRNCVVWDGERWRPVGGSVGTAAMGMVHVVLAKGNEVYVGGMFDQLSGYFPASHVAYWDGFNWDNMNGGANRAIRTLVWAPNGDVYAGGEFTTIGGKDIPHIARWDGNDWHGLAGGMNQHAIVGVLKWGELYVGGRFTKAGGKDISYLARWDGNEWHAVGGPLNGYVTALVFKDDDLYVGGGFTSADGKTARGIARWNGTSWSAVGGGFTGPGAPFVRALYVDGDDLFAGGFFSSADGRPVNHIARWRGQGWEPLGSGLDNTVKNITRHGDDLYVTGEFRTAGGKPSAYVARWNEEGASDGNTPSPTIGLQNYPNPFNPLTTIDYTLPQSGHVRLSIYDINGALIRVLVDANRVAGPHSETWDGTNDAGAVVGSGVYVYRFDSAESSITKKMVFVK